MWLTCLHTVHNVWCYHHLIYRKMKFSSVTKCESCQPIKTVPITCLQHNLIVSLNPCPVTNDLFFWVLLIWQKKTETNFQWVTMAINSGVNDNSLLIKSKGKSICGVWFEILHEYHHDCWLPFCIHVSDHWKCEDSASNKKPIHYFAIYKHTFVQKVNWSAPSGFR